MIHDLYRRGLLFSNAAKSSTTSTRRELIEVLARAVVDDESGAISWSTIKDIGEGLWDIGKQFLGGSRCVAV